MPPEDVLAELQRLAARIGVAVRYEAFDLRVIEGRGGLCYLRGRPVVVMDGGMPLLDKIFVLAEALARFGLQPMYVPAILRKRLEARARPALPLPLLGSRAPANQVGAPIAAAVPAIAAPAVAAATVAAPSPTDAPLARPLRGPGLKRARPPRTSGPRPAPPV